MPTYLADDELDLSKLRDLGDGDRFPTFADWDTPSDRKRVPKVLFIASSAGEGGIERHSVLMAGELVARGVNVMFACGPNSHIERSCETIGLRTRTFRSRNSGDPRGVRQLLALMEDFSPGVVHVHSRRDYVPALMAAYLLRARGKNARRPRIIIHSHLDKPLGVPGQLARRFFAGVADCVVAVSDAVKKHLIEIHGFAPSFVRVLHNGIDLDAFVSADSKVGQKMRQRARKNLGIPADAQVIGMVGRLNDKGQADLISAAAPVIRARRGLWIVLVGPGSTGDMDRLTDLAKTEGVSGRVLLTGPRDDVPEILPAFDMLVHLPETESFGLALVEAMASGLPTITADVGGCGEVVEHGVTGFVVERGNGIAVQAAIKKLLADESGEALRKSMGEAGRNSALTRFSLDNQVNQLIEWYRELAAC